MLQSKVLVPQRADVVYLTVRGKPVVIAVRFCEYTKVET